MKLGKHICNHWLIWKQQNLFGQVVAIQYKKLIIRNFFIGLLSEMCQIWQQDELSCTALSQENCIFSCHYRNLVETFHVASECNTAVYFSWSLIQAFAQPVQLFWPLVTFSVTSCDNLTDSDLQLYIETEQDRTRHMFIQ